MRWWLVLLVLGCDGHPPAKPVTNAARSPAPEPEPAAEPARDCVWIDVFEILDRVYFDAGSSRLRDPSLLIVDAIAETIRGNPRIDTLGVVGGRAPGEPDSLALDRANAMTAALQARGVPAQQLEAHGFVGALAGDPKMVWFVMLRVDHQDRRPPTGDARLLPWERDCAASWKAHREHGDRLDCDCAKSAP